MVFHLFDLGYGLKLKFKNNNFKSFFPAKVCSDHFLPSVYKDLTWVQQQLPQAKYRSLKKGAIPTENLYWQRTESEEPLPKPLKCSSYSGKESVSQSVKIEGNKESEMLENTGSADSSFTEEDVKASTFSQPTPSKMSSESVSPLEKNTADSMKHRIYQNCGNNTYVLVSSDITEMMNGFNEQNSRLDIPLYEQKIRELTKENKILKRKLATKIRLLEIEKKKMSLKRKIMTNEKKLQKENIILKSKLGTKEEQILVLEREINKYKTTLKNIFASGKIKVMEIVNEMEQK